jgi:uncharacterized protein (DUF2062 family)
MSASLLAEPPPAGARRGFWSRRVVGPIRAQLTQGVSPDALARTLGVGAACSLFPFLGFTSLLNLAVGLALRMNQPILQTLNQLLGPLQLVLILAYVRIGEVIWRATDDRFTIADLVQAFRDKSIADFLERFGWAGVHALTAWLVTSPFLIALVYCVMRPLLQRARGRLAP